MNGKKEEATIASKATKMKIENIRFLLFLKSFLTFLKMRILLLEPFVKAQGRLGRESITVSLKKGIHE